MTWSSKQQLSPREQASLARDLLAISMKLQNEHWTSTDITKILEHTTQAITMRNIIRHTLINRGND